MIVRPQAGTLVKMDETRGSPPPTGRRPVQQWHGSGLNSIPWGLSWMRRDLFAYRDKGDNNWGGINLFGEDSVVHRYRCMNIV